MLVALLAGLVVLVLVTTPWSPWARTSALLPTSTAPLSEDFDRTEIASSVAFQQLVRAPAYLTGAAAVLVSAWLGLTRTGARIAGALLPRVRRWWLRVVLGTLAVTLAVRILVLPFDLWLEAVRRDSGVSTQSYAGWAGDTAIAFGVTFAVTAVLLVGMLALVRKFPRWWWALGSAIGAGMVVAGSFVYPILVEPLYNHFTPMPAGQLRTELLDLAARDHVPVGDVLIADESRRTTRLNAYVSGFGSTRRIVVYDTLLTDATPDQVRLIVAHELGHAKHNDVLRGTVVGAVGVASGMVALALLLDSARLRRRAGLRSAADPRVVALVIALTAIGMQASLPLQNAISRRIEASADVHALDLTRDPQGYAEVQRWLAVSNRSDLTPAPVLYVFYATHPTAPERIALIRTWSRRQGLPAVPAMATTE